MALENIISRITKDAGIKQNSLQKNASRQIEELLQKTKEESARLRKKIVDEAKEQARVESERTYSAKNLEKKKEILRKKRQFIDEAFSETLERLFKLDDKKYIAALEEIVLSEVPKKPCELQFSKKDKPRIKKDFVDRLNSKGFQLKLGPYFDKDDLGFLAKMDKIIIDCTFSKGLEALKSRVQSELSKILFG